MIITPSPLDCVFVCDRSGEGIYAAMYVSSASNPSFVPITGVINAQYFGVDTFNLTVAPIGVASFCLTSVLLPVLQSIFDSNRTGY